MANLMRNCLVTIRFTVSAKYVSVEQDDRTSNYTT